MMQKCKTPKNANATTALISVSSALLLAGCGSREGTVTVPPTQTVKKTVIEKIPNEKPKTVVIQAAPKPAAKTETETKTNVTVEVKPQPKSPPASTGKLPEPSVAPKPNESKLSPPSTPTVKQPEKPKAKPVPRPAPKSAAKIPSKTPPKQPEVAKIPSSKNLQVRAEVIATSRVPDPKSVTYKNALVFTKYKVLEVKNGEYNEKEILVAQWAMKDKKLQPAARLKKGEVRTLSLEPLSKRSDLDSVMRNDDTEELALEPYYAE